MVKNSHNYTTPSKVKIHPIELHLKQVKINPNELHPTWLKFINRITPHMDKIHSHLNG
jgi:hypothetical protein